MKLIFATNNQHKIAEIRSLLPANLEAISLNEAGINIDISEPYSTLKKKRPGKSKNNSSNYKC